MNPKFKNGIPWDYVYRKIPNNKITPKNTCDTCKRICEKLYAHEFKLSASWPSSLAKNFLSSFSGTNTTIYCERRLCDACFRRAAPNKLTCRKNDCAALISFDLKSRCIEYDDHLYDLVFTCPLDRPCNQQLTYDDFMKHSHNETRVAEKMKSSAENSAIENKISHHENEIKRLHGIKETIAGIKKSLENTKSKREKENNEIKRLMKNQKVFDKEIRELEIQLKENTSLLEPQEEDENTCGVCMERYNSTTCKRACISSCFHCFCFSCLNVLNPKHCPKCRNPFTNDQIKKLF